jgi:DNA-binding IclR family transcriptional regulator
MNDPATRPVTTVETAADILAEIKEHETVTLQEIASSINIAKSTAHRHLKTLERKDLVTKDGQRYRIGLRMLDFGMHVRTQRELFHATKAKIDELADETDEKVWCVTHEHGQSIHLYGASGRNSVHTHAREGQQGKLHQLAAGKAILSTFPRERVEAIIDEHGLPPRTENTITDRETLFEELERVAERGYAFNRAETVPRLKAVGAPINNESGLAIGAISISGPSNRMTGTSFEDELPDLLLGATNEIEINLNYS